MYGCWRHNNSFSIFSSHFIELAKHLNSSQHTQINYNQYLSTGSVHCVIFLGKTLYSHIASPHSQVWMGASDLLAKPCKMLWLSHFTEKFFKVAEHSFHLLFGFNLDSCNCLTGLTNAWRGGQASNWQSHNEPLFFSSRPQGFVPARFFVTFLFDNLKRKTKIQTTCSISNPYLPFMFWELFHFV